MRSIILDPYCGATEDMIVAALIGLGADEWRVKAAAESLAGAPLNIEDSLSQGIAAKSAAFDPAAMGLDWPGSLTRQEAVQKLNVMHEKSPVRSDAMSIIGILLTAMESAYGSSSVTPGQVGLIAAACAAYDSLGRPRIFSTPAAMGMGMVEYDGRRWPVPKPETLEIAKGAPLLVTGGPFEGELLTPCATAILSYFTVESGRHYPEGRPIASGYGAGTLKLPMPYVLRASLIDVDSALLEDGIELLETNVDDVTGEVLGSLIDDLISMGARDVSVIPATMKKGRAGHLIRVVAKAEDGPALARRIMLETGTLGVRVIPVKHRLIASREISVMSVAFDEGSYDMRFKVARDNNGSLLDISVEYDDAKNVSKDLKKPLKTIIRKAETQAWKKFEP